MHLASEAIQSSQWDLKSGTSSDIHPYALVESFLLQDELRRRLDAPFIGTPYTIGYHIFDHEELRIIDIIEMQSVKASSVPCGIQGVGSSG